MYSYNNYGNTYMPPMPQRPMTMPQQPQVMQAPPIMSPFQDVRFVNEKEAEGYIVSAGQKVLLIDNENKKMWIKFADNMGCSSTETYRFERIEDDGSTPVPEMPVIDTSMFLVREDLKNVATRAEVAALRETIERLEKQVKISQILNEKPIQEHKKEM